MMKARHLFDAHSGNVKSPREKSRPAGSILQMKRCNDNILSRMAETTLFSNLTENECQSLLSELDVRIRSYSRGEIIVLEGHPVDDVIVILKGEARVYGNGVYADRQHLVHRLRPGDVYGASFAGLDLKISPGMVRTSRDVEVLLCKVAKIRDLVRRGTHAAFVANLYTALSRQHLAAWRKLSLVGCYEIADRILLYLRWRQEDGLAESPLPSVSELAEYLGVNRTALYRGIAKLKRQKRIIADGKTLRLFSWNPEKRIFKPVAAATVF